MSDASLPELLECTIPSSMDDTQQPLRYWHPATADGKVPLLVYLHTWGGTYQQAADKWLMEVQARGWAFVQPHFRGPNVQPEACGSPLARQDVIDATHWAIANLPVDTDRVYLAGGSGGGHMTMRVASQAPELFAAASEWCGIASLIDWHREHTLQDGSLDGYGRNIVDSTGGAPGSSDEVDAQYRDRSPIFHIEAARDLPIDFSHGIHDGKTGSVPFHHSVDAFNVIARCHNADAVSEELVRQLWDDGKLADPLPQDTEADPSYGDRPIYLRRYAGPSRLTIFEGGHEAIAVAGCHWLAQHSKRGKLTDTPTAASPVADSGAADIAG